MRYFRFLIKVVALSLVAYLALALVFLNGCSTGPYRLEELEDGTSPPTVDGDLVLARRYAPWIYHQVDEVGGRQDIPAPVDFDGDLDGTNNWENMIRFRLVPTVYYAVLETGTHWFLSYHLFHPRDWTEVDLGLHLSHENDGENLQVVVEKSSEQVVLLYTQAHFKGRVYSDGRSEAGSQPIHGPITTVDKNGFPRPTASHVAVFVESHGHGIYGVFQQPIHIGTDGQVIFDGYGMVLRPRKPGEAVEEPPQGSAGPFPYRLESLTARLWPLLRDGHLVGEGRLLDGTVPYSGSLASLDLPRYYEADRWSGPLGSDRGISPFALDFGFAAPTLGSLFFDPARRYREVLQVPEPWSLDYLDYPFVTASAD